MIFLAKILRFFISKLSFFTSLENLTLKKIKSQREYPIFIIGLPRSGSTLLFQLLINNFKLSYFSNLVNVFFRCPVLILKIFKKKHLNNINDNYQSNYGVIKGIYSPSESGSIYNFWLKNYNIKNIKKTISFYIKTFKAPFICKNLNLSFKIKLIKKTFPESKFIYVTRDPKFIFQSIFLKAKSAGEINIEGFRLNQILNNKDYFKYLMSQIKKSNKKIISDLNETNSSFMVVDYSDICNNTSLPGTNSTTAPKSSILITLTSYISPCLGLKVMLSIFFKAESILS